MDSSKPISLTEEQLDQIIGGVNNALQNGISQINPQDLAGMDLETALMAVQSQRAQLLEGQLKSQIEEVQKRNEATQHLNTFLTALNHEGAAKEPHISLTDKIDDSKPDSPTWGDKLKEFGIEQANIDKNGSLDAKEIAAAADLLKGKIDSLNSSQQMDMLRLQSLTNKRNEAFDVMTNFIKKMQDSRSSIIGNMR